VRTDCKGFRTALEAELLGRPSQEKLAWLSWHAHLLACSECRALLEKEEALEALLASLPEPRLPAALARRVLIRLREDRTEEKRLDRLLELEALAEDPARAPEGLAAEILARLAPERTATADARLEALLDLDREIPVPAGLALRVRRGLAPSRRVPSARPPAHQPARKPARRIGAWWIAAAAGVALLFFGRRLWVPTRSEVPTPKELAAHDAPEPDPQMLASLDVVEQWDLLMQDDVDVLLSTLGPADEALLEYR
jgi:hypothetical protein